MVDSPIELSAVEEILARYSDMVYKIALSQLKNKLDADDVFQEVFLRLIGSTKAFQSDDHVKAWLIRVTINCCKKHFITFWKKQPVELNHDIPYFIPEKDGMIDQVLSLPRKYRLVIHLFYYEDFSVRRISEMLNIKESTVKSQLSRGRQMLKEKIESEYDE